jgi:hypothetical protein
MNATPDLHHELYSLLINQYFNNTTDTPFDFIDCLKYLIELNEKFKNVKFLKFKFFNQYYDFLISDTLTYIKESNEKLVVASDEETKNFDMYIKHFSRTSINISIDELKEELLKCVINKCINIENNTVFKNIYFKYLFYNVKFIFDEQHNLNIFFEESEFINDKQDVVIYN